MASNQDKMELVTTPKQIVGTVGGSSEPLTRKPAQHVLDEDTYTEAMSNIIERDFFPSLAKLKAQHEYLDALEINDVHRMHAAMRDLSRAEETPLRTTPGTTPRFSSYTPLRGMETPGTIVVEESQSEVDTKDKPVNTNLSLDAFQSRYTSEDNASFTELVEKANAKNRQRYKWIFDKESDQLLLADSSTSDMEETSLQQKLLTEKGAQGVGSTLNEENARGKPKQISYNATRLESAELLVLNKEAAEPLSRIDPTPYLAGNIPESPNVAGFSFVAATPSPSPSQLGNASPLMTWGTIEGAPLLISSGQTPGPSPFKLPPTPRREVLAQKLSERASKSLRKRVAQSNISKSPAPMSPRMASPNVRAGMLSPAAQRLLSKSHRSPAVSGADPQLRSSYSSTSSRGRIPVPLSRSATPSPSPLRMKDGPANHQIIATASTINAPSSITDGLLNLDGK